MLIAKRVGSLITKKNPSNFIKKKKPSQLTVNLLSWQEQLPRLLIGTLKELEKIVTIND